MSKQPIEPLESRRLLASTLGAGTLTMTSSAELVVTPPTQLVLTPQPTRTGTLVIKGTSAADRIHVVRDGNLIKYSTTTGDTIIIKASQVKRVLIEAGGGDDKVFIDPMLLKRCTVLGGGGDDVIDGPQGATLIGGGGNDKLSVPASQVFVVDRNTAGIDYNLVSSGFGSALLSGGEGNDVLVAGTQDTVIGGRGKDAVIATFVYNRAPSPTPVFNPQADFGDRASGIEQFIASTVVRGEGNELIIHG